jgi:hypothetical protein
MKEQSGEGHVSAFSIEDGVTSPWVSLNLSVLPIKHNSSRMLSSLDIPQCINDLGHKIIQPYLGIRLQSSRGFRQVYFGAFIFWGVGRHALAHSSRGKIEGEIQGFIDGIMDPLRIISFGSSGFLARAASTFSPAGKTSRRVFFSFG